MKEFVLDIPRHIKKDDVRAWLLCHHPDVIRSTKWDDLKWSSRKEFATEVLAAARAKGYTIIQANDPKRDRLGFIASKMLLYRCEGERVVREEEMAYASSWPKRLGPIGALEQMRDQFG